MSRCKKCNIEVLDKTDKCPLCHQVLEKDGVVQHNMYPDVRIATRRFRMASNCLLFVSIVAETIMLYINYLADSHFWWSFIVGLILIYVNVTLRLAIMGRSGYQFKIISLTFIAVAILVGIDFLTGYKGWSVNYIFPAGIILVDAGILVLMAVNRRNWQSYMMLQIFMILLGLISLILVAVNVINFPYFAVAAFGVSVFIFLGTVIIGDQRARTELKRRFHL